MPHQKCNLLQLFKNKNKDEFVIKPFFKEFFRHLTKFLGNFLGFSHSLTKLGIYL